MVEIILTIVAAITPLLVEILQEWREKQKRPEQLYESDKRKFDAALAARDATTVSILFDELRSPETGGGDISRSDGATSSKRQL